MQGWSIECRVGRVVEVRILHVANGADARAMCNRTRETITRLGVPAILCADYRAVPVFADGVADELKALMIDMNPYLARSGALVAPAHATNLLQVTRVLREAQNPERRRFSSADELLAWFAEITRPDEQARAAAFLAEGERRAAR